MKRNLCRQRLLQLWIAFWLLAALSGGQALAQVARDAAAPAATAHAATREGRLRVFDEVWALVGERYYDPALRGTDWAALGAALRPSAAEAASEDELYAVLRRLLAPLRDPHTRVFPPGESTDWRVRTFVSVGVTVLEVGGEIMVTKVERGAEAWRAGVRAGDVLASVDGVPAAALVARRAAERPAQTDAAARLLAAARLFDGERDTSLSAVFRRGARERRVVLRREQHVREPELTLRTLRGGVALVRFNVFTQEIAARLARALGGELKGVRSLVLDLRDNGGGEAEAMADVASFFLPAGTGLGLFTDREGRVLFDPRTRAALISSADELPSFTGPVVVLTGPRTASAAEVLAASLREQGRARLIGEGTCGCVLGIRRRQTLPDGGTLDISETDYRTARGTRLEGAGLAPDEVVAPTREDILRGRDRVLDLAARLLTRGLVRE